MGGIFDSITGRQAAKNQKGVKRHNLPPAEQRARAEAQLMREDVSFIRYLKKTRPIEYMKLMLVRQGTETEHVDKLAEVGDTIKQLQSMGFIKDGKDVAESDDSFKELLKVLAVAIGPILAQKMIAPPPPLPPSRSEIAPAPAPLALTSGSPVGEPSASEPTPSGDLATQVAPATSAGSGLPARRTRGKNKSNGHIVADSVTAVLLRKSGPAPVGLSPTSAYLCSQLANKTPEEAATWLLDQKNFPAFNDVTEVIIRTSDEQVPPWMNNLAVENPDLRGFVDWIASQPAWFLDTLHLVRSARLVSQGGNTAGGS
jgi:hypothetical protein